MFATSSMSNTISLPISVTVTAAVAASGENFIFKPRSPQRSDTVPVLDTPTITNIVFNALEGVQSGVPTRPTSTLTPSRLRNIEQIFELQLGAPEIHSNQAGFVPPFVQPETGSSSFISVDSKGWGGGVATLTTRSIDSSPSSGSSIVSNSPPLTLSAMPSLTVHGVTPRRMGGRRPARDDKISPEEEGRRQLRRERNKQAAARCRKRRLDQTTMLQDETEGLDDKRSTLHQEILLLQQQRDELEFLLAAHKSTCKKSIVSNSEENSAKTAVPKIVEANEEAPLTIVKIEVEEEYERSEQNTTDNIRPLRPTSLSLNFAKTKKGLPSDLGITIETPSNGMRSLGLNFESMMEGGTGLTPIATAVPSLSTGLTPLTTPVITSLNTPMVTSLNTPMVTSLNTPIVTSANSNCGTQQRSGSSPVSHKLVLL